ncbi:MAG: hypothetical protein IJX39_04735 [Clostridia bacterium]|nr:hypothetical protein [Clostridia bacterium]
MGKKYIIDGDTLQGIADAIRAKTGGIYAIFASDFATAIADISASDGESSDYIYRGHVFAGKMMSVSSQEYIPLMTEGTYTVTFPSGNPLVFEVTYADSEYQASCEDTETNEYFSYSSHSGGTTLEFRSAEDGDVMITSGDTTADSGDGGEGPIVSYLYANGAWIGLKEGETREDYTEYSTYTDGCPSCNGALEWVCDEVGMDGIITECPYCAASVKMTDEVTLYDETDDHSYIYHNDEWIDMGSEPDPGYYAMFYSETTCPDCGRTLYYDDDHGGSNVECPYCGASTTLM